MKSSLVLKSVLIAATAILSLLQRSHGAPVITISGGPAYDINHSPPRVTGNPPFSYVNSEVLALILSKTGATDLRIEEVDGGFVYDTSICKSFTEQIGPMAPLYKYENIISLIVTKEVYDACFRYYIYKMVNAIVIIVLRDGYFTEIEIVKAAQEIINQRSNLKSLKQFDIIDENGISAIQSSLEELATTTDKRGKYVSMDEMTHPLIVYTSLLNLGYYKLKYSDVGINDMHGAIPEEAILAKLVEAANANNDYLSTILFMAIKELKEEKKSGILAAWSPTTLNPLIQTMFLKHGIVTINQINQDSILEVLKNSVKFGFTDVVKELIKKIESNPDTGVAEEIVNKIESNRRAAGIVEEHVNKIEPNRAANKRSVKLAVEMIELSAAYGHLDILEFFVDKAGDSAITAPNWINIIRDAVSRRYINVIEYWLGLPTELRKNLEGEPEKYGLEYAVILKNPSLVNIFLVHLDIEDINRTLYFGGTLLMQVAVYNDPTFLKMFLKHKKHGKLLAINRTDKKGFTALAHAVKFGCTENVELLLSHDTPADASIVTKKGKNLIILAAEWGRTEIFQYLLDNFGINYITAADNDGKTALMYAAKRADAKMVQLLLEKTTREYMMKQDDSRRNALMYAVKSKNIVLVKLFLDEMTPGEVEERDSEGNTALMIAITKGYPDTALVIINHHNGSGFNLPNNDDMTPLHMAVSQGFTDVVRALLPHLTEDDINKPDGTGNTALSIAEQGSEIAKLMVK